MRREWMLCLLLAALTLGVYWPVQHNAFIYYDDPQFIAENPEIRAGLTSAGVVYAFTQPVVGNWHPVTVLSHMLDCELFGADPGPQHLVNAVLHTLNALILFWLMRSLTGANWRSILVAAIFAFHPLRVESVAWVSERKDVLSGLFFLLTLWAWGNAKKTSADAKPGTTDQRKTNQKRVRWLTIVALACSVLGLMSKPMVVTLPFVLLLLDLWPLRRVQAFSPGAIWPLFREKIPFFVLAAVCSAVTLRVQRGAGAMAFLPSLSFGDRVANATESYLRYVGKFVWPTKLAIVYPHPAYHYYLNDAWPAWQLVAAGLVLILISIACLLRVRHQPYLSVGWFWFLGTLVPVIGLVQVGEQAMANRYTYIPLIGPTIALVWGMCDLLVASSGKRVSGSGAPQSRQARMVISAVACIALAGLAWMTRLQVELWRDTVTLFKYAVEVTPDNPSAQFALGVGLEKEEKLARAMVQYRVALAINPNYTKASYNLGQLLSKAGEVPAAAKYFGEAVRSNPTDLASRLNLANALQRLRRTREAAENFEECLRIDPGSIEALNNLAWILATDPDPKLRNGKRAVELAERTVALSQSKFPVMIGTLAAAYAEAGRFPDAIATAQKAADAAAATGQPELAQRNLELLELYRASKPFRSPVVP